jgi:hypothetical protein
MKNNRVQNWQMSEHNPLDAALAKYAKVEPRTGLEERILANLQAEREHATLRERWLWEVAAAFAMVVIVIIGLNWKTTTRSAAPVAHRPPAVAPSVELPSPQIASTRPRNSKSTARSGRRRSHSTAPANPKLDQFPSPQPLSDQEKILASYVDAYPEHAVLLARARTEEFHRDQIEEKRPNSQSNGAAESGDRNEDRNGNK